MKTNVKLTIYLINKQVSDKNILCISREGEYVNNKTVLKWQCLACNYIFEYSKNFIDCSFIICKNCRYVKAIDLAQTIASQKGGRCLTTTYTGSHDKIVCSCKNGHIFNIAYNNMVNLGHWCQICSDNKFLCERIVRTYFESLFNLEFPKIRPLWLRKDNGYLLELDGYCDKINLSFEHNGEYHYTAGFYNKDFKDIQTNDLLKKEMCAKNNVTLIVVPSLFHRTPINKLREFIINECGIKQIIIPFPDVKIDLTSCYDY